MSARPWRVEQMYPLNFVQAGPWVRVGDYATEKAAYAKINRLKRDRVQRLWTYRLVNRDTAEVVLVSEVSDLADRIN